MGNWELNGWKPYHDLWPKLPLPRRFVIQHVGWLVRLFVCSFICYILWGFFWRVKVVFSCNLAQVFSICANLSQVIFQAKNTSAIQVSVGTAKFSEVMWLMCLVGVLCAPLAVAPTVSLYHPSDFLRSASELFRLLPPRSGTHCRTVSSQWRHYRLSGAIWRHFCFSVLFFSLAQQWTWQ